MLSPTSRPQTSIQLITMNLSFVTFLAVLFAQGADNKLSAKADCDSFEIDFNAEIGLHVERRGTVPTTDTAQGSYNMDVFDNFNNGFIFFVNQKQGKIYSRNGDSNGSAAPKLIFDAATSEVPAGLDLTWNFFQAPSVYKVKAMTQGRNTDEVIVVFTSTTLPDGWTEADAKLPPPVVVDGYACSDAAIFNMGDAYRFDTIPSCAPFGGGEEIVDTFDVFYTFDFIANELTNPTPFFVSESRTIPGHLGGGISTLPSGDILWATGDCLPFGMDGSYAPQLDFEACGKILKLDPSKNGEYRVVAKGVRNSQKIRVFEKAPKSSKVQKKRKTGKNSKNSKNADYISFMDIGGVTAEEVNAFPLEKLDSGEILNFGWGRSLLDGKAREGTFYVNNGRAWVLRGEPSCNADQPANGEEGFIQPWVQFGRTPDDFFFGISSMAIPPESSDMPLIWSEFNTGTLFGTLSEYEEGAEPAQVFKIKLVDDEGPLDYQMNSLVKMELNLGENDSYRGDPRLFHFPDGEIGVLMERTGVFYKLTQQSVVG